MQALWLQKDKDRTVEDYQLLIDLHKRAKRQGPGGDTETEQDSFEGFLKRNGNSERAQAIVDAEKKEIALYEKYKAHYSNGVYVARKLG
jgi:hypothetical protein